MKTHSTTKMSEAKNEANSKKNLSLKNKDIKEIRSAPCNEGKEMN
jgi:hypothetical protein